jgi:glycosyltransferase involved in cell wall biosynthesis
MRIIIPILGFSKSGGARVLSNLASEWVKSGVDVVFIVNYRSELPYFPTLGKIIWVNDQGEEVSRQASVFVKPKFWVLRNILSLKKGLDRYVVAGDILLANHAQTAYSVFFTDFKKSVKKFYYVQAYEPEYCLPKGHYSLKGFILYALYSLTYLLPMVRIVNSPLYFKYKLCRSKLCVLPGIDLSIFYKKPLLPSVIKTIGVIGRQEPFKGTAIACEAFLQLLKDFPYLELRVAYYVPEKYVGHEKIVNVVAKNDEQLAEFYRSCDIFLALGTIQQGAPHYPVMESLASGCAVVNTNYIPATEENSWLVPANDVESVVEKVKLIISNPRVLEYKLKNTTETLAEFSWLNVGGKMLNIFRSTSC